MFLVSGMARGGSWLVRSKGIIFCYPFATAGYLHGFYFIRVYGPKCLRLDVLVLRNDSCLHRVISKEIHGRTDTQEIYTSYAETQILRNQMKDAYNFKITWELFFGIYASTTASYSCFVHSICDIVYLRENRILPHRKI